MGVFNDPAAHFAVVTPSDTDDLPAFTTSLRVGTTAGNIAAVMEDGSVVVIPNVQIGEYVPIRCIRVNSTSTTAAGITAFW